MSARSPTAETGLVVSALLAWKTLTGFVNIRRKL
jgi:hypothetical protein